MMVRRGCLNPEQGPSPATAMSRGELWGRADSTKPITTHISRALAVVLQPAGGRRLATSPQLARETAYCGGI